MLSISGQLNELKAFKKPFKRMPIRTSAKHYNDLGWSQRLFLKAIVFDGSLKDFFVIGDSMMGEVEEQFSVVPKA